MSAIFPSAVAATLDLLEAINNTKVTLNADAGIGDTTLTVDDASPLPTSGYLTFDDNEANPETVYYTGKAGNDLTGVSRGADSTASGAHITGAHLEQRWNAAYHNTLATEIIAVEQNISDRLGLSATQILSPGGSASAPSHGFAGDPNTGMYSSGADAVDVATGGTRALGINSSQQIIVPKTTNQIILGATNLVTLNAAAPSASRIVTIVDPGADASFVMTQGTQTIVGATTFSTALTITPVTNQIVLGTTRTVTITAPTPASASRTWTIPDLGADATFMALGGTQTVTGAKTLSATLTMSGATIAMGSNKITGLANGTTAGDALAYGQPIPFVGTTTNDDAAAGYVGQYLYIYFGGGSFPASGVWGDWGSSMSLTAGDWDVTLLGFTSPNSITPGGTVSIALSTTSGNSSTGLLGGDNWMGCTIKNEEQALTLSNVRFSLASTTTVYAKFQAYYTGGPPALYGRMSARRVR